MKKILVTGGAGFIGSHLAIRLAQSGDKIFCLDNLFSCDKQNLELFSGYSNIEFIEHDICNAIELDVDEIYNLACPASPHHYQKDPVKTIQTNVIGTYNMLELAKSNKAKIFQASTSEVYGDPTVHPQPETYWGNVNPIGIRSCYDEGKRCAETLFFDYHRQFGVEIKVMRIFNTYGPNMAADDGRVVSNFIVQALAGDDITIYGDGSQTRSFCYVADMVDGIVEFMNTDSSVLGPINCGNPIETKIEDLAKTVIKLTGSKSRIINKPLPADDPVKRKPNTALMEEICDWSASASLEQGLSSTIAYFQTRL